MHCYCGICITSVIILNSKYIFHTKAIFLASIIETLLLLLFTPLVRFTVVHYELETLRFENHIIAHYFHSLTSGRHLELYVYGNEVTKGY